MTETSVLQGIRRRAESNRCWESDSLFTPKEEERSFVGFAQFAQPERAPLEPSLAVSLGEKPVRTHQRGDGA